MKVKDYHYVHVIYYCLSVFAAFTVFVCLFLVSFLQHFTMFIFLKFVLLQ